MIHERKTLVQRPRCHISRCSCGVYHLSTGSVTLRMEQPQLEELFHALTAVFVPEHDDDGASEDPAVH